MRRVIRGFPRAVVPSEFLRYKLHEDQRLLYFRGKDARAVLRAATANDLDELHFSKTQFAQSSLALDNAERVLCPLTLVKPVEFGKGGLSARPGEFLVRVPTGQFSAFEQHLSRFSAEAHVEWEDLTADFDQFAVFTPFRKQLQRPGELLREFYSSLRGQSQDVGNAPDLCFIDPHNNALGFEIIAFRQNGLLHKLCPPSKLLTAQSKVPYHLVHRLFAHCFDAESVGQFPLQFNADFNRSIAPSSAFVHQRACTFVATRQPIVDYAKDVNALDNTQLLSQSLDLGFEESLAGRKVPDARGRPALQLTHAYFNLAVGLLDLRDCAQDYFAHEGLYFYRVKYRRFENFLKRVREVKPDEDAAPSKL